MRHLRPLAALLLATAAIPAHAQSRSASPAVAPIAFTERTLPNGLRVFAIRDTKTTNVSVQVWYHVGSKDDPAGRSGFAHMFEHLMFKATRNLAPEQFDRLTEDVGGNNNASTADDYTEYHEVVPANHLQRLLFAEADRMAALVVDPASYASERDVVKEELRQRTLADPYGKLLAIYYPELSYTVHPYARPGIGNLADLTAASIDDVRAFHQIYYRPDNAVLVVAGNFDSAQLDRWVDQYFRPIARPSTAIPRVTAVEPARTAAVSRTVYEANVPLPAVLLSWHVPADRDPDYAALAVLDAILSTGESSRLYQSLVYRDGLAQAADTFLDTREGTGNLVAYAVIAGGKSVADGEAALRREVARLRDAPTTAAELARAKNQIVTRAIRSRETAEGRATTLANSVVVDGDPRAADRQLAAIDRVTAADVQRVARRYLNDAQSAAIRYLPLAAKPAGATDAPIAIAPTVQVTPVPRPAQLVVATAASPGDRVPLPVPGPLIGATSPHPVEMRLANGLRVVTVERHDLPLVTAALVTGGGAATDPAGRAGASSLAADLLTKGTTTRSATQIAEEIESLGGSIGAGAARDGGTLSLTVKSDQLARGMAVLADVAEHPAFAPSEIARARAQAIDGVTVQLADPAGLASLVATRAVFGDAPYGAPLTGTPGSLKAITPDDLRRAYAGGYRPDRAALLMIGDVRPAQAEALATRLFGGWSAPTDAATAPAAPVTPPAPRTIVVDMPAAGQAGVVVARPGVARADPGYYPLLVANAVLGGGYSARLNQEVRVKRGLAYGASSGISARRLGGIVAARTQTKNESAADVVALVEGEMAKLGRTPASAAELETRKASLLGDYGRAVETTGGLASVLADYLLEDVPLAEIGQYAAKVAAVDPAAATRAAAAALDPAAASIVVVGDAKAFLEPLKRAHPQLEVIPQGAVQLDSATLR
ncbi:M16 family metallopeptidase [uncultured Sphingomonas sp.]|uniref:M16 family metallopeptidase n=1 Tax=uncultured Sphingomonas sp. TaxID=158754 RepID=UPI0035CB46CC